jgi:(1->4)-alpha-D-glucan 1-alpha-D-glucosylmutase
VKLFVTAAALRARTKHIDAFRGEYLPIAAVGSKREHLVAFARRSKERTILAVVPRFVCTLTNGEPTLPALEIWEDTALDFPSSQRFRNTFTGEEHRSLRISDLFRTFPVAILEALS